MLFGNAVRLQQCTSKRRQDFLTVETVNIHEAKTNLSRLIERVQQGEEIIISTAGKPVARLTALDTSDKPRKLGVLKGKLVLTDDFYEPRPADIFSD